MSVCCRVGVYPMVSAEHVARGLSAKVWVDHVVGRAGRGKGKYCLYIHSAYSICIVQTIFLCDMIALSDHLCSILFHLICTGDGKADQANGSLPVASEGDANATADQFLTQVLSWAEEYASANLSK